MDAAAAEVLAGKLVRFLEVGDPPPGLFRPDVFCDFTMPQWRLQFQGLEAVVAGRRQSHPALGQVARWRCDPTPTGFVVELEERWREGAGEWYCREMFRADVSDGAIAASRSTAPATGTRPGSRATPGRSRCFAPSSEQDGLGAGRALDLV